MVALSEGDTLDAARGPSHAAHLGTGEADGVALVGYDHGLVLLAHGMHEHKLVVLEQPHGDDAVLVIAGVEGGIGAFDHAVLRHKEEGLLLGEAAHGEHSGHPFAVGEGQKVVHVHALGRTASFRNLVDPELVHASLVGEEAEVLVVRGGEEVLHAVILARVERGDALAAPVLLLVVGEARALHVAAPREGDDNLVVGDEIHGVEAPGLLLHDIAPAGRGVVLPDVRDLVADDAPEHVHVGEDGLVPGDILQQAVVLGLNFLALQAGEALQAHVEDGPRLDVVKPEAFLKARPRLVGTG